LLDLSGHPFEDLRILDTSTSIAGAYATKLLADGGADVVKVEPAGGDPLRAWTASCQLLTPGEDGALFHFLNACKRSTLIDPQGEGEANRDRLLALAGSADVVVEDTGVGSLASRGLDFAALQGASPRVSLLSISPFGLTGPWADRPATEFTLQAASGSTAYRGLPERGPVAAGGQIGEWAAGAYAAVSALVAWLSSRRTGAGQHVDLSMFEVAVASLTIYHDLQGQWLGVPLPQSIETPSIEPTKDGWIGIATYTGQQWKDFCLLLGRPDVGEDEKFYNATVRMDHLAFIQELMHGWTRNQTTDEIMEIATAMRVPAALIGNGKEVLEMDHFQARGVFIENPAGFLQPRRPYRLSACDDRPLERAPRPGQHDAEVAERWAEPREPITQAAQGSAPFADLRVVDLSAFWAGPVVTSTLAELGADVIKVESIQRPDGMRFAGAVPKEPLWERSPVFHGANIGKRAITLDLDSDDGKAIVRKLLEDADVLIENFSARVMDHFGLDWQTVHDINPRLVMIRMPAWGLDGPWRDRVGFAANVEQASGLAWITGYRDMPLIMRGVCDPVGGMHTIVALTAALEHRRKTGQGQLIECALAEPALNLAAEQIIEWSAYGVLLTRDENRGPAAAPQGCYRCAGAPAADRDQSPNEPWVAIAVQNDAQWLGLRRALGDPSWAADAALDTAEGRRAAHDAIDREIGTWAETRSAEEATAALLAEGVPASVLTNAHFLMPNPQLEHRGFFFTREHPVTGPTRYPGFPARFPALAGTSLERPAPTLGQHNDEILGGELGKSEAELERLREAKVIGQRPAWEMG
jgi:crotonobetainyl-CoA:carnitine CoA-transferase CaiB-like acyl-CoA transferase